MFAAIYSPIPFLFENDFLLIDSFVTDQFFCVGQRSVHHLCFPLSCCHSLIPDHWLKWFYSPPCGRPADPPHHWAPASLSKCVNVSVCVCVCVWLFDSLSRTGWWLVALAVRQVAGTVTALHPLCWWQPDKRSCCGFNGLWLSTTVKGYSKPLPSPLPLCGSGPNSQGQCGHGDESLEMNEWQRNTRDIRYI